MSWLQLEFIASPNTIEALETALFGVGCVSVTLLSESDEPVLEPRPGETPLWERIRCQALFALEIDLQKVRQALADLTMADGALADIEIRFVGETDWQAQARRFAVDAVFGQRLHLRPPLGEGEVYETRRLQPLFLEPGLAFGSGSHPTTRMCLEWIANHIQPGWRVLDFGCGSGVLAIAAALLGADVVAVDHDDQAVAATGENAERNGVSLRVLALSEWQKSPEADFDAVVANILAEPLRALANEFVGVVRPGGSIVLAGLLADQMDRVQSGYPPSVRFQEPEQIEDWVRIVGVAS